MTRNPPRRDPGIDVEKLAQNIQKKFGADSASIPGKEPDFMLRKIKSWIPVGKLNAILAHESNGIPCGYYIEISGGEGAGKTTLAYYLIGIAQKAGAVTILADIEHSYDPVWSSKQGVDNSKLIRLESAYVDSEGLIVDNADQHFKKWEYILYEAKRLYGDVPKLLIPDSLAAMLPKEQLEGDYGERSVGALARAMAVNLPKFHSTLIDTNTACIFINQLRDKIGVMFGETETTPGGRAKNFYFFSRVSIKKIKTLRSGERPIGIETKLTNKKNKLSVPFLNLNFSITFKDGLILN